MLNLANSLNPNRKAINERTKLKNIPDAAIMPMCNSESSESGV